jgi:DTW domain-containing protein YfiP
MTAMSFTPAPPRCDHCLLRECLCAAIPVIATRTRIVIIRHPLERFRSSNTGRLAARALTGATLVEPDAANFDRDGAWLVYPEGEPAAAAPDPPPRTLVVLDASWHQARRMRQRIAALRGVPVLRLPVDEHAPTAPRMRASPGPGATPRRPPTRSPGCSPSRCRARVVL